MESQLYDKTSPKSIESYAKQLIGHTFLEVLQNNPSETEYVVGQAQRYGDANRKGGLGNLLEKEYFHYEPNSKSEADFVEAGVELKATPYEITKSGKLKAGERLVLSMIDYSGPIADNLYDSHVWKKCHLILLVHYWRNKELENNLEYPIHYVTLFTPSEIDLAIIENDYKIISQKIMAGKAEELSESDTLYLGACTKGATAEKSIVAQYYPPHSPAKRRAFCYKNSYMTFVLNEYVVSGKETYESIIQDSEELKGNTFEQIIISRINQYKGLSDQELCSKFGRDYNNNKAQWTDLAYRMLGIKSNRATEFRKANITVKVIRLEEDGKMRENMSFPPFKYMELIKEEWDTSTLHDYFDETKFLFVVFKKKGDYYYLQGCQLWNMPYAELNTVVKTGWENIVNTIKNGIEFHIKKIASGVVVENNLPKKADNPIIHVRPHAKKRFFRFTDGTIIGDGSEADANELPDGTLMPNYSFWINNEYILSQLNI